jgi:alkylhydroperoxidase family enzyme
VHCVSDVHSGHVDHLRSRVLSGDGVTSSELRQLAADHAGRVASEADRARASDALGRQHRLPSELEGYVETVARHAYKTVDQDIENLKKAGYSEDAIFELTVSAALGVALEQLDRATAVIRSPGT